MTVTIDELPIPAALDAPGGVAFREMVDVRNAVTSFTSGGTDLNYTAEELLPHWQDEYEPKRLLLARVDGRIVGRGIHEIRTDDEGTIAWLNVEVLPEFRAQGIGSALADGLETLTRESGRTIMQAYSMAREAAGDRLESPTGFGSVPLADPSVRFLQARGWTLEQVERFSRLVLPDAVDGFDDALASAAAVSGPDYRLHTWVDRTPEPWLADIAMLSTRMSTDAPSAGLEVTEDVWTVERVLEFEALHADGPRRHLFAAVEHVPTGGLVGYTELTVPAELDRAVSQDDTIVIREHRGHRLGMLLKVGNLAHLLRTSPGHPSVTTFNAEENRHMLAVNEAVGFVAAGYEGAWQRAL